MHKVWYHHHNQIFWMSVLQNLISINVKIHRLSYLRVKNLPKAVIIYPLTTNFHKRPSLKTKVRNILLKIIFLPPIKQHSKIFLAVAFYLLYFSGSVYKHVVLLLRIVQFRVFILLQLVDTFECEIMWTEKI